MIATVYASRAAEVLWHLGIGPWSIWGAEISGLQRKAATSRRGGARGRNRTADTMIFSHVLYQLSYPGIA